MHRISSPISEIIRLSASATGVAPHLDKLLVLVKFLKIFDRHGIVSDVLGTVNVVGVSENTYRHLRPWDLWHLDGSRKTLVSLWVVVLQTDLELDGFCEGSLFRLGCFQHLVDGVPNGTDCDLRHR